MKDLTRFERPKTPAGNREYLTIDEVKQLVKIECIKPMVKQAFLFSCFSGLRFSDVKALKWDDFQTDNEGKQVIRYIQQKTKKDEYLQVSDEALKFLPERGTAAGKDTAFILPTSSLTNQTLQSWVLAAGIKKRVTFHVGRHTNATLLLSLGAPIETVSKLLGHSAIKTTQIYAKVIDKNKRAAVSKLDGLTD
jgi:integrase